MKSEFKKQNPESERQRKLFTLVRGLYENSEREMAHWMWEHHVPWVADKARELAAKYGANIDMSYAGAILHDVADALMDRFAKDFDIEAERIACEYLDKAGFSQEEIQEIIEQIIAPHSCHEGNLPKTLEGKILATADALAHYLTNFFSEFERMGIPTSDKEKFRAWAREKVERDFFAKIFFDDERELVSRAYEQLKEEYKDQL